MHFFVLTANKQLREVGRRKTVAAFIGTLALNPYIACRDYIRIKIAKNVIINESCIV